MNQKEEKIYKLIKEAIEEIKKFTERWEKLYEDENSCSFLERFLLILMIIMTFSVFILMIWVFSQGLS